MQSVRIRSQLVVCSIAILLLATGCQKTDQPPLGTVHGVVTLDGQPLPNAIVYFSPDGGGRVSQDMTDANGEFDLVYIGSTLGAKTGPHSVRITTAYDGFDEASGQTVERPELVPKRYNGTQTELKAEVKPGRNTINFDLKSSS